MALQTDYASYIPNFTTLSIDNTTLLVDASGEKCAVIIRVAKTGTLRKVGFRTGTVVQNQTIKVSFQDVSTTTGDPDESIDQFRTISIADTDDNVWKLTGLITSDGTDSGSLRTVTRGDLLAIVWENNSFTAGDVFRLSGYANQANPSVGGFYGDLKAGAGPTWTKVTMLPGIALVYDDGAGNDVTYWLPFSYPLSNVTTGNFSSSSNPSKKGLKFRLPYPFKTVGCIPGVLAPNANGSFVCKLYDSDGTTVLQTSATVDTDVIRSTSAVGAICYWPTDQSLLANTYYYITVEPTAAVNIQMNVMVVNSASFFDQMDGGQDFHYVDNTGGGGLIAVTTQRPHLTVMISALDDAVPVTRANPLRGFLS